MMKRLSLKGLRISSQNPRESGVQGPGGDQDSEPGGPHPHPAEGGNNSPNLPQREGESKPSPVINHQENISNQEITVMAPDNEQQERPPTQGVKKREKGGFFKSLKRRLTGNFQRGSKRESVTEVIMIEDENSSENRDDGSLHCTKGFYSARKPRLSSGGRDGGARDLDKTGDASELKGGLNEKKKLLSASRKEDVSKSEESSTPTEEEKVEIVFLTDAEYGHTSAPFNVSGVGHNVSSNAPPSPGVSANNSSETELPSSKEQPKETVTPPPPLPEKDIASDLSDNQGACAMRSYSPVDDNDLPPSEPAPPPPMMAPAMSANYQNQDIRNDSHFERNHSSHLALIGGGLHDPEYYSSVYDQLKEPPKSWSLTKELFKLSKYGWYWGPITRVEAEEKLISQADGAFLVRDSSDERYLLSLSFRSYGRTLHTRIEHCNGVFSFYAQPESEGYYSIVDLIEHSMNDSQTGVFCYSRARTPGSPSFPVRLTKPVSRFTQVRSLQYLCRFVIRQYTRLDHIQKLPLPSRIRGWLEENQY